MKADIMKEDSNIVAKDFFLGSVYSNHIVHWFSEGLPQIFLLRTLLDISLPPCSRGFYVLVCLLPFPADISKWQTVVLALSGSCGVMSLLPVCVL